MKKTDIAEINYRKAIERLDEILIKIENDDIDVDELSLQVKEAVDLVKMCKAKIDKAEMEVKQVVDGLAKEG
jgi:exodeoxyribonuclease VII small subunit